MEIKYMEAAIAQARLAENIDEVPIGCVIVKDGKIISKTHNLRESSQISTAHAEILAINKACKKLKTWRLEGCELYVTIEPCPMCAGAIMQSRITKVYYGAKDPKGGSYGSNFDLNSVIGLNHYVEVTGGILEEQCSEIIKKYFKNKRNKKNN